MLLVAAGKEPQPEILGDVGVLVLVDEDVAEPAPVAFQQIGMGLEDADDMQQEIAEIGGVERAQALLVVRVELRAAVVEGAGLGGGHPVGRQRAVLPAVDEAREHAGRPALLVDVLGLDELLEEPQLVVHVEDGEVRFQAGQFGMAAQELGRERVEGAEPGHALDHATDQVADAAAHLAGGLVGEGDGEDLVGLRAAGGEELGDAGGERPGLAGAGAGEHQDRAVESFDGSALVGVEGLEPGCGARGDAGAGRKRPRGGLEGFCLVVDPAAHAAENRRDASKRKAIVHGLFA